MIVGKVVGSIVSTRKSEKLIGNKFMIVEPVHHMKGDAQSDCCNRYYRCRNRRICIGGTRKRGKNWLRRRNSTGRCRHCRYR